MILPLCMPVAMLLSQFLLPVPVVTDAYEAGFGWGGTFAEYEAGFGWGGGICGV